MRSVLVAAFTLSFTIGTSACELCAIYSASNARGESLTGFQATLSEQFTAYQTVLYEGRSFPNPGFLKSTFWDRSITHLVAGYNFSERFGLSLNMPLIYNAFDHYQLRYDAGVIRVRHEKSSLFGPGDVALIGRWAIFQKTEMKYSIVANVFAGVKFPTGDTERVEDEVQQAKLATALLGRNHEHNVLPVHQADLSLGSGSFDGVFGTSLNLRWDRWFFDNQIQYYLRSEAMDYKFGNQWIVSGGPGAYILLEKTYTISLQAKAFYESMARDEVLGRKSNSSGLSSWYVGPLVGFTWSDRLSGNVGVDIPWHIYNHGLQIVPDYRVHGGLTWRF